MTSRTTAVGTLSGGSALSAANYNDSSGGWIRTFTVTSNQGSITSETDLTGLTTGSFTVPLRRYLFMFDLTISNTATAEMVEIKLYEDTTELKRWDFPITIANAGTTCTGWLAYSPTNAAHTYKLALKNSGSGTGTLTLVASAAGASPPHPAQFQMIDIGPQ
jgi:hypothetical protein